MTIENSPGTGWGEIERDLEAHFRRLHPNFPLPEGMPGMFPTTAEVKGSLEEIARGLKDGHQETADIPTLPTTLHKTTNKHPRLLLQPSYNA